MPAYPTHGADLGGSSPDWVRMLVRGSSLPPCHKCSMVPDAASSTHILVVEDTEKFVDLDTQLTASFAGELRPVPGDSGRGRYPVVAMPSIPVGSTDTVPTLVRAPSPATENASTVPPPPLST